MWIPIGNSRRENGKIDVYVCVYVQEGFGCPSSEYFGEMLQHLVAHPILFNSWTGFSAEHPSHLRFGPFTNVVNNDVRLVLTDLNLYPLIN